jgi:hypothetical protein
MLRSFSFLTSCLGRHRPHCPVHIFYWHPVARDNHLNVVILLRDEVLGAALIESSFFMKAFSHLPFRTTPRSPVDQSPLSTMESGFFRRDLASFLLASTGVCFLNRNHHDL